MKKFILLFIVATVGTYSFGQNHFPKWDTNALVQHNVNIDSLNKPYTLIVYGGVGCGYSKYLIENLGVLSTCRNQCDIILIMDQSKDSITKHMNNLIEQYPTFTNTILQYRLRKKADIFPQLLLFKNRVQIDHVVGVKEGMLSNVKQIILDGQ